MNLSGESKFNQARMEWAIRMRYSPMPELDMQWVASQLNAHRIGELRVVGKTWEVMMERDAELAVNADKRYSDVASLDWQVEGDGSLDGDKHAAALKYFYEHLRATSALEQDEVGGVHKLIKQTMTALSYRHSVHEMLMRVDNAAAKEATAEFRHTPVWFFECRRGYLGFLKHIFDLYGEPCAEGEWLTAVGQGWMRPLSVAFVIKHFPLRDWLLFCTRYGTGFLEGVTNAQKDSQEWADLNNALAMLANDGVILHNPLSGERAGMDIKIIEQASKNNIPMQPLVEWVNRLYAKVYRGNDLSTGSRVAHSGEEGGGGKAVGASVQKEESSIFLTDDANWVTETFNARIDAPVIRYLFDQEPRAKFRLMPASDDQGDSDLKSVALLVPMGLEISKAEARRRFKWAEPEDGEPILGPGPAKVQPGANGGADPNVQTPNEEVEPSGTPNAPNTPEEPKTYRKPGWTPKKKEGSTPGAAKDESEPIAPGAIAPGASKQTANSQMPSPQVDAAAAWSRVGRSAGANGTRARMPALAYAIPNATNKQIGDKEVFLEAIAREFEHINKRLEGAGKIDDPEVQRKKLASVMADLEQLKIQIDQGHPELADAIYKILCKGVANGIAEGAKARPGERESVSPEL